MDRLAYTDLAPRLSADYNLVLELVGEQSRRLIAAGHLKPLRSQPDRASFLASRAERLAHWWPYDATDYAPEAPDLMPAGSCVSDFDWPEQRVAHREDA